MASGIAAGSLVVLMNARTLLEGAPPVVGRVDYRLAREAVLTDLRRGRLVRRDVCDAHPELLRAASNVGTQTTRPCPVCEKSELVLVQYAFGRRLPPSGRCVTSAAELRKLSTGTPAGVDCYVVEVCCECHWNHLTGAFHMGQAR